MEKPGVQDTLLEMVDRLKKNKYIRWAFPHFLFMPRSRSASVDFWFSAFKESELREEEKSFYEKLGAFLINQPKYIQVGALLQIQFRCTYFHSLHFCQDLQLNVSSNDLWDALEQGTFSILVGFDEDAIYVISKSVN